MKFIASPNFNARSSGIALDYIVLHYTGMKTGAEALTRMCDKHAEVSAHYMIDEDGAITQLVEEQFRAWHAGKSFWRGITDINSASIGIELVNPGHEFGYRDFPAHQIDALIALLLEIILRHGLDPAWCLLAHSDVAPERKTDPGELFPWQRLAQEGLGVWPVEPVQVAEDAMSLLKEIGYDVSDPTKALLAFQRRFYPENMSGVGDAGTVARLFAVKKLLS